MSNEITNLFDLDFGINLEDLQECVEVVEAEEEKVVDLFDGKFDISFFGIIPNTFLREDTNVLRMLVLLSSENMESRIRVKSLIKDMDIFLEHMTRKLKDVDKHPEVDAIEVKEVFNQFSKKYYAFKEAVNEINCDVNLSEMGLEHMTENIDIDTLTRSDYVNTIIASIINKDTYDKTPLTSSAVTVASLYKSLRKSTTQLNEAIDSFSRLKELSVEKSDTRKSAVVETLKRLLMYSQRSYSFSAAETQAMKYLDFPYQAIGYESASKSDPRIILDDRLKRLAKAKGKMQETYKQATARKDALLTSYSTQFQRKSYMCSLNDKAGVNMSCIYF